MIIRDSLTRFTQLMAMVTWTKKKFKQIYQYRTKGTYCDYMGDYRKIKKQHSFRRQQLACSAQSAQMGGYFSLSTTGPSKGVLFFNFSIVSHVVTICTFGPILVDLLELFLVQVTIAMSCDDKKKEYIQKKSIISVRNIDYRLKRSGPYI